jgi:hypothetical protein
MMPFFSEELVVALQYRQVAGSQTDKRNYLFLTGTYLFPAVGFYLPNWKNRHLIPLHGIQLQHGLQENVIVFFSKFNPERFFFSSATLQRNTTAFLSP